MQTRREMLKTTGAAAMVAMLPAADAPPRLLSLYSVNWMTGPGDHVPEFRDQFVSAESAEQALSLVLEFEGRPKLQPSLSPGGSKLPAGTAIWFVETHPDGSGEAVVTRKLPNDQRFRIYNHHTGQEYGHLANSEWAARGPGLLCPGDRSAEHANPADYPLLRS